MTITNGNQYAGTLIGYISAGSLSLSNVTDSCTLTAANNSAGFIGYATCSSSTYNITMNTITKTGTIVMTGSAAFQQGAGMIGFIMGYYVTGISVTITMTSINGS